jgi:hypothetical protein
MRIWIWMATGTVRPFEKVIPFQDGRHPPQGRAFRPLAQKIMIRRRNLQSAELFLI